MVGEEVVEVVLGGVGDDAGVLAGVGFEEEVEGRGGWARRRSSVIERCGGEML